MEEEGGREIVCMILCPVKQDLNISRTTELRSGRAGTFASQDLLLSLGRARIESQECAGQVKTETFQSENERSK